MKEQLQKFLKQLHSSPIINKQTANSIAQAWLAYRVAATNHFKTKNQETTSDVVMPFINKQVAPNLAWQDMKKILEIGPQLPFTGETAAAFASLEQIAFTGLQELTRPLLQQVENKNLKSFYQTISNDKFDPNIVSEQGKPLVQCLVEQNTHESIEAAQVIVNHPKFDINVKIKSKNKDVSITDYLETITEIEPQTINTLKARKEAHRIVKNLTKRTFKGKITALLSNIKKGWNKKFNSRKGRSS